MATTKATEVIQIRPPEMATAEITIAGITPLIVHKWSEKARRELLKESSSVLKKRVARNPWAEAAATVWIMDPEKGPFPRCQTDAEFEDWMEKYQQYTEDDFNRDMEGLRFGFPATAIKKAAISSVYREGYSKSKVELQSLFFIEGYGQDQLVEIIHDGVSVREDNVKVGMGTADLRYRAQFENWSMKLRITYDKAGKFTLSQIVHMIALGGMKNGIGEWRTEKGGAFGMFKVQ